MKGLTQAKRDQARQRARASIHRRNGPPPTLAQFKRHTKGRFSTPVKVFVYLLILIPLMAFSTLSAMRLYEIGKEMHSSNAELLGLLPESQVSGGDVVLGAEFAQIIFVVALAVLVGERKGARLAFIVGIILSTLIALIGNAQAGLWHEKFTAFRVLITFAPPVIVLVLGEVLALLWLDTLAAGHEAERLYSMALDTWSALDRDPEQHPDWSKTFATALRDMLCQVNNMVVDDLPSDEWLRVVDAEMRAEDWYVPGEFQPNSRNRTESKARARKGLVEFVEGPMSQAEKVKHVLAERPDLLHMAKNEAAEELGVGMSTLYKGIEMYQNNGNSHHSTNGDEGR
jgi:hypothetical protein